VYQDNNTTMWYPPNHLVLGAGQAVVHDLGEMQ